MKDDAKFFFFLSGFLGFLLFYFSAVLFHKDFMMGFLYGTFGCMVFANVGRFFLRVILKTTLQKNVKVIPVNALNKTNPEHVVAQNNAIANNTSIGRIKKHSGIDQPLVNEKV